MKLSGQVLAGMYDLPHHEASFSQDVSACKDYVGMVVECLDSLLNAMNPPPWCSKEELKVIEKCKLMMEKDDDGAGNAGEASSFIKWLKYFPEYGSLVIAHANEQQLAGEVKVSVLGMDGYELGLHPAAGGDKYDYTSHARSYKPLIVGSLLESDLGRFKSRFAQILSTAKKRTGDKRSAAGGVQGHQFTPALIHALLLQAKKCDCDDTCGCPQVVPKGGFTDNGLHTGGKPRNTSFPLVRSFFQWCMVQNGDKQSSLFRRTMVFLDLHVVDEWLSQVENQSEQKDVSLFPQIRIHLDWAMTILGSASLKFDELEAGKSTFISLESLVQYAKASKKRMVRLQDQMQDAEAEKFHLRGIAAEFEAPGAFRNPVLSLKPERPTPKTVRTLKEKRAQATRNIGMVPLVDYALSFDVHHLKTWACSTSLRCTEKIEDAHLVIATIEKAFWERAEMGLESELLDEQGVDALLELVNRYRAVVHTLLTTFGESVARKTEIYSREFLVVWIAYCLIFASNRKLYHRILPNMGVALKYQDLEHLVLPNKREWSIVHDVKRFLKKNHVPNKELFSLRCPEATFDMGETMSRSLFGSIFAAEREAASRRVDGHWAEVCRKKRLVTQYKEELNDIESELRRAKQRRDEMDGRLYSTYDQQERRRRQSEVDRLDNDVNSKKSDLKSARKAPEPVVQPLPRDESKAHRWLFFLYMPDPLRALATISFTAQQMLMPKPYLLKCEGSIPGIDAHTAVSGFTTSLPDDSISDFYNQQQSSVYDKSAEGREGKDGWIMLRGLSLLTSCCPQQIGPDNVEYMSSSEDGVWYPDIWRPRMAWRGGPNAFDSLGTEINPYYVNRELTVAYFTEVLDQESNGKPNVLQWAMIQDGDWRSERGNEPIATQDGRSLWLSKPEYLSFGKVRAFPLSQVRSVLSSLLDNSLPLNEPNVHKLIFQAMFHIGCISEHDEERFSFVWKRDLYNGDAVAAANAILHNLANELCETPNNYYRLSLLGELCGLFSAWDPAMKDISRRLAGAAIQWAKDLEDQLRTASDDDTGSIRLKQSILLRHAILCYAYGPMEPDDEENIIVLTAKCRNIRLDDLAESDELCLLESKCLDRITGILQELEAISVRRPSILTTALESAISKRPDGLEWSRFADRDNRRTACFESHGDDGCLYTINIVTGVVLVDGMPPSSLPAEILEHDLYRRSFGAANFEVVAKNGILETIGRFAGKRYRFFLNGSDLCVEEVDDSTGHTLELLNALAIEDWGNDLPVRLKKMHSHWLSRDDRRVILRGIQFNDRAPHFVLELPRSCWKQSVEASCRVVPKHASHDQLLLDLEGYDRLVLLDPQSTVGRVLDKFERFDFIHVHENGEGELSFNMPRFGLSFAYRDGLLHCQEISGSALAESQLVRHTMSGFHRYLVLEHYTGDQTTKVLVPEGDICRLDSGFISVTEDKMFHEACQWHRYKLHKRFGILIADDRAARLRLAAIHAATSLCMIDQRLGMTGVERSAELVRQCWTSSPLSLSEVTALRNLSRLCESRHSILPLLCMDLLRCSEQVSFLYSNQSDIEFEAATFDSNYDCDEVNAFAYMQSIHWRNGRSILTPDEQSRLFGQELRSVETAGEREQFEVKRPQLKVNCAELEKLVLSVLEKSKKTKTIEPFPLSRPKHLSIMEKEIYDELEQSWSAYGETRFEETLSDDWEFTLNEAKGLVQEARDELESYLKRSVNSCPTTSQQRDRAVDFLRLSNMLPTAAAIDFARTVYDPEWITGFNPLLSKGSQVILRDSVLTWLRLCVLEDKLQRLTNMDINKADVLKELATDRIWDPTQYPAWLAFEVENGIQIRPEQFVIAQHLLKHPGHIVQLNMGLGKTRVILPMLILHWSFHEVSSTDRLPRLNILSNLFSEANNFFSKQLCGSIARLKVFLLPFCRDVELDETRVCALMRLVEQCRRNRGVFIVAPEHRLSLELKVIELYRSGEKNLSERLGKLCHSSVWRDVLDESDELLHHRFQLIYACGSVTELPEGIHRFRAAQVLFRSLRQDTAVQKWVDKHSDFITLEEHLDSKSNRLWESFPRLCLNMERATPDVISEFRGVLVDSILSNPPVELDWLRDRNHPLRNEIRAVLINPTSTAKSLARLSRNHLDDVLALRGLLAGGIFVHNLQKRHRVDYGIARPGKKRIAVPFRGADVPADRSEFAQADCAIVLSCLAYYSDGLDEAQLHQAFETLLTLGKEAKRKHYQAWFEQVRPRMQQHLPPDEVNKLDCVEKIDLSNVSQFEKLVDFFQHNMKTIDFWLNSCVFPDEMQYYPQRLTGTSWNLAESSGEGVVGFSGTNDNHKSLPQQVEQYFENAEMARVWKKLMATNGLMLSRILHHTSACEELPMTSPHISILNLVKRRADEVHAIVDSGALFAGLENLEIAKLLLDHLPACNGENYFPGVVFLDDSESTGQWKVLERSGRLLPKDQSPVSESKAFAFFDEPRCRGSDLKLDSNAVALLTLGKKMNKDKFMQAAGRMRKLGHGQKLIIVGMKDVMDQVKHGHESLIVEAKHVLEWTMRNTCESNIAGLVPWAAQGLFHCTSYRNPNLVVEDEKASIEDQYGGAFDKVLASEAIRSRLKLLYQRMDKAQVQLTVSSGRMLAQVLEKANRYGTHMIQGTQGADEECERELEIEREREEEEEIEIPRLKAVSELEWSLSSVFSARSPSDLPKTAGVMLSAEFVSKHTSPTSINLIGWTGRIYGTRNFFMTVVDKAGLTPAPLNHYLRLVDVGIFFPSGEILLVSERESDILIGEYWDMYQQGKSLRRLGPVLFHLSLLRTSQDRTIPGLTTDMLTLSSSDRSRRQKDLSQDDMIAELQLFAGETAYRTKSRRIALKGMLQGCHTRKRKSRVAEQRHQRTCASAEPEHIVGMRGFSHCLPYSDLEQVCKEVAHEEENRKLAQR